MINQIDKYKVAADIKRDNPKYTHKEVLEIADEVVKIYFASNCSVVEAVEKVKEMNVGENIEKMEKAN